MPMKIGKSVKQRDGSVKHEWIGGYSEQSLIEMLNVDRTRPKDKVKIRKELQKRCT